MVGIALGDQNAERTAQARQRRQRFIDYTLKRLRPRHLQRKVQEYLMEHPKAIWNDFSTLLINKDVSYQVSTSFLNDEEQNKAQMASLGQELKNLRTELKEHRIKTLEGNQRPVDPNQKGRQKATSFCGYCRTNGHTPNYCRKKIRDEEIKKLQTEATAEKKVTFTQDYNKKRGPFHVSGNWTKRNEDNGAMVLTPRPFTRGNFRPSNPNTHNFRQNRTFARGGYTNNNNDQYNDYRARSPYQSNQDQSWNWGSTGNYSQLPSMSRQDSSFTDSRRQPRSNSPNPSVFNRFWNSRPEQQYILRREIPNFQRWQSTKRGSIHYNGWWNQWTIGTMPFKLLRSPSSTTNQSKNSRLSFNFFYFATGDTQKDRGLEIEFMLDQSSSSIINYRTFWEVCQTQHPITVKRSTTQTRTYFGQVVPLIGFATIKISYDPDGQFSLPLTVWITEMKTQNLLGIDFRQKQVSGIDFDLPGNELKEPPDTVCYGSLHQNKSYPFISQILTIRTQMQCTLKPRVQDVGSTLPKIPTLIFLLDQLSTQIVTLLPRASRLSTYYAPNQNHNYLY